MGKFIDEVGATRHAMSDKELNELYKRLENFIADCTIEEATLKRNRTMNRLNNIFLIFRQQKENKAKCVKGKFKMPTKKCRTQ